MILAEGILLGIVASLLTGGSVRRLAEERLTGEWILVLLLPAQLMWPAASQKLNLDCPYALLPWLLMMATLSAVLMLNSSRRWMLSLAALGVAANVLVIGVNQAMPVDIRRASEIGTLRDDARQSLERDCLHEELDNETRLSFLADVIAVPGPEWQRGVVSAGDILLTVGLSVWVFVAARESR
jgi:hypothetical protein